MLNSKEINHSPAEALWTWASTHRYADNVHSIVTKSAAEQMRQRLDDFEGLSDAAKAEILILDDRVCIAWVELHLQDVDGEYAWKVFHSDIKNYKILREEQVQQIIDFLIAWSTLQFWHTDNPAQLRENQKILEKYIGEFFTQVLGFIMDIKLSTTRYMSVYWLDQKPIGTIISTSSGWARWNLWSQNTVTYLSPSKTLRITG